MENGISLSNNCIFINVNKYKKKYLSKWYDTSTDFPQFKTLYTSKTQKKNCKDTDILIKQIRDILDYISENQNNTDNQNNTNNINDRIISLLKNYLRNTFKLSKDEIEILFSEGYLDVTDNFIRKARAFNNEIDILNVFQAIRNVWIMNSIQILLNKEVKLTPSIFSYSMLYPYLDNYLDNTHIGENQKKEFNKKIRNRIQGELITSDNKYESDIYKLFNNIENQYDRDEYSEVYDSLLCIQTGQEKSLYQQTKISIPYEKDILGISFEKGGTSVLADGYLVKGNLTDEEAEFMFGYGVFLQIIDDLQDVDEDKKNGHMTIFSQIAGKYKLDKLTNRLFRFINRINYDSEIGLTEKSQELTNIIFYFSELMVIEAIFKNSKYFSKKYIKKLQSYSIFKYKYFRNVKRKSFKNFNSLDIEIITKTLSTNDVNRKDDINWLASKVTKLKGD